MYEIKKRFRAVCILISAVLLLFSFGCGKDTQTGARDDGKPVVAVTIVPQETFVKAVCGDLAEVVTLVPPGGSPENYEPTAQQMEQFSDADIYFTIGVPVEQAGILPDADGMKTVALADEVAAVYPDLNFPSGDRDPHIWLSPKRVIVMIEAIAREMGTLDEANSQLYNDNAQAYITKLEDLDAQIKDALEGVSNRKFVVYHPAFGYLADDYDLEMFALEEEGKEATAQHLQEMIDLAKQENIKAIFYQEEIDSSQSEAYAEELGGRTVQLAPLASDYIANLQGMAETMAEVMQ